MTNELLESYLERFQSALVGMTLAERQDIVEEIRVHVEERLATGMSVAETLTRLGPADELAREYCRGALVRRAGALARRASRAFSPWLMLRAAFAWAMTGLHGIFVFLAAMFGYGLGFGFAILAVLKFIFPDATGLWVGGGNLEFGIPSPQAGDVHEILGKWFEPVAVGLAALFLSLTTFAMRKLMAGFRYWRASALSVKMPEGKEAPENQPEERPRYAWIPPVFWAGANTTGAPWLFWRRRRRSTRNA